MTDHWLLFEDNFLRAYKLEFRLKDERERTGNVLDIIVL